MADALPTRSAIDATQLAQLRALVESLLRSNAFHQKKFSAAGINSPPGSLTDFADRFPFTSKQELVDDQHEYPPFGSNLTFPLECYTRCHQTSGTSSTPLRWLDTPESWDWMLGNWDRVYEAASVTKSDRIYFAFSFGPFLGFWTAFESGLRNGCLCLPGGGLASAARVRAILDQSATVLCCTPTYAIRLAEVAAEEKISLAAASMRKIIVAGEPGGSIPGTRRRIEQLWPGARLYDHHGMTEVGPVTYECPARPGVLHVIESAYVPEVVDPATGHAVHPGETGELVLTNLGRTGSPVVRYRTGDLVKPAGTSGSTRETQPCGCGRHDLALEGGILGRTDDMAVVRGVNIYPSAIEDIMRSCGRVAEYQVQVDTRQSLTELSLQIEPDPHCDDVRGLARDLENAFQTAFALRIPVRTVAPGSLPRFEMKAGRWVKI